jgi:hypothetical protein
MPKPSVAQGTLPLVADALPGDETGCDLGFTVESNMPPRASIRIPAPQLGTRADKVLARLTQGPATGLDLLKAGGGTCYRDQVRALRRMGHNILGSRPWTRPDGTPGGRVAQRVEGWDVYRLEE